VRVKSHRIIASSSCGAIHRSLRKAILLDSRLLALRQWVGQVLDLREVEIRPASTDASFRRYFRIIGPGITHIVMDAPPGREDPRRFMVVAERLHQLGLNVPEVLDQDLELGFLLLTDLGDQIYLQHLNASTVERLYGDALGALVVLQAGIFTDSSFLPEYDTPLLRRELEIFREWYLGRHLGLALTPEQQSVIDTAYEVLIGSALEQPRVWVHRDFHSRNLMITARNNPGILDFQDAVRGPVTYDLVSLLRDCYIRWPQERVVEWVMGYFDLAHQSGLPVGEDERQFLRWFDLMGVQRHLKAAGIFARLNHRDSKPGYLADIPRTLGYVLEVCSRYPELVALQRLLADLPPPGATS
jgi:aminoglycoside/choline kinase family phosphotransferase